MMDVQKNQEKTIRLAIIRQRYNSFGGAERFIERAIGALLKENAEISLITRTWSGTPQEGVRQVICDPKYSKIWNRRLARDRSFAQCAFKEMVSGRFDITQSHERIPGCRIFRAGDGVHAAWLDHKARGRSKAYGLFSRLSSFHRYILRQEAAMLNHPALQAVICNSVMVRDEMLAYYNVPVEKLYVIENGIDLEEFHPNLSEERARTRKPLGITEDTPVFLFVGNGFERKGVEQLLLALSQTKNDQSKLVIVGNDRKITFFEHLAKKKKLENRVIFTGPQENVKPFYGMADAFALPTRYDPMPNAALEAMACGLPLITSTTCGMASRVTHGENGFVCDALDIQALAEYIDALSQPGAAGLMREKARAAVLDLGLEAMASKLIALYRHLL